MINLNYKRTLFLGIAIMIVASIGIHDYASGHLYKFSNLPSSVPFYDGQYDKTTWQEFYKIDAANKTIDLLNPDYELLAAAVFYATNEFRQNKNLPQFKYSRDLRDAAENHSRQMCDSGFFGHNNRKDTTNANPRKRINKVGGRYFIVAENLARIVLHKINNPKSYYPMKGENISSQQEYKFFDKKGKDELETETYIDFGKKTIKNMAENKANLANLLSLHFSHSACAVALPREPYKKKNLPLGIVTQTFGGYKLN